MVELLCIGAGLLLLGAFTTFLVILNSQVTASRVILGPHGSVQLIGIRVGHRSLSGHITFSEEQFFYKPAEEWLTWPGHQSPPQDTLRLLRSLEAFQRSRPNAPMA